MCGIVGIVHFGREEPVRREDLERMNELLVHRGPDEDGYLLDGRVGLAMRRLKVIDLDTGSQPIGNEDGTVQVVLNGEIYNYVELRAELEANGHRFRTASDTEVLVHLWEERGEGMVEPLEGMFAFAVRDSRAQRLFLARDRAGQKPLYWFERDGRFVFASELTALLAHPAVGREVDPQALADYLLFEHVPLDRAIVRDARKLPAAHFLVVDRAGVRLARYWDLPAPGSPHPDEVREGLTAVLSELRRRLRESVRICLRSDVPLGIFLSGGVDSSTLVWLACELRPPASVRTFNIRFEEQEFDESPWARLVAKRFGTEHHEERFGASDILALVPEVAGRLDEPLADASLFPTYLLCRETRRHVTVALGGDGADELFGGYETFLAHRAALVGEVLPPVLWRALGRVAARALSSPHDLGWQAKLRQFLRGVGLPRPHRAAAWLGAFLPEESRALLDPSFAACGGDGPWTAVDSASSVRRGGGPWDGVFEHYFKFYLDQILTKVDRASMANSLEVRAPYLDRRVVEYASSLPLALRLRGGRTKFLLKKAAEGHVPREVLARPKRGFGIPKGPWLAGPLRPLLGELLAPERLRRQGIFRPDSVATLVREHLSGARDHRKKLWTLLVFQLWWDRKIGP
ncbi:MAG: asparagine synthase (glutamine-hydrolyzing) [Planctomycetes bacterium]|nr:asparagine synthase (glutamine-hydrolyzing) [Planctomycetota bacterium]